MDEHSRPGLRTKLQNQVIVLGGMVALLWAIEAADHFVLDHKLDSYGIRPRQADTMWSALVSWMLHGGFAHLSANTASFVVLGWLVILRGVPAFLKITAGLIVLSGLGTWLLGRTDPDSVVVHLGASGLIFGYLGFLITAGIFERRIGSIFVSFLVGFLYGGALVGVMPGHQGVSWEAHLSGLISGIIVAQMVGKAVVARSRRGAIEVIEPVEDDYPT